MNNIKSTDNVESDNFISSNIILIEINFENILVFIDLYKELSKYIYINHNECLLRYIVTI